MPSRSTRTPAARRSRRSSRAGPLRLRPVPDVEPGRGRVPEPRGRGRPLDRRPGRAAPPAGRPARRELGTGRHGRSRGRRDGPGRAARDPGRRAGSQASSSRASGPRAVSSSRSCATGPRRRRPRHCSRVAGCWSTCRAGSARPRSARRRQAGRTIPASASRRPPATGPADSLCYPSPRTEGHLWPRETRCTLPI